MTMIWNHIKEDFSRIKDNSLVVVILLGLSLVPCMYAWFNIAASWDPYEETGGIHIAVASEDEGYRSTIAPVEINIGDEVKKNLGVNDLMDWNFTDEQEAIHGVKSGKYYAAIVIPKDFSEKMFSFLSTDAEAPVLRYYSNEKKNAIASSVTSKGADAITEMLKDTFTETLYSTSFDSILALSNSLNAIDDDELLGNVQDKLKQGSSALESQILTLRGFQSIADSGSAAIRAGDELIRTSSESVDGGMRGFEQNRQNIDKVSASLKDLNRTMKEGLDKNLVYMDMLGSGVDELFLDSDQNVNKSIANMQGMIATLKRDIDDKAAVQRKVGDLNRQLPVPLKGLELAEDKIAQSIDYERSMVDILVKATDKKATTQRDANALRRDFLRLKDKNVANLRSLQNDLSSEVFSHLFLIRDNLDGMQKTVQMMWNNTNDTSKELIRVTQDIQGDLESFSRNMDDSMQLLQNAKGNIDDLYDRTVDLEHSDAKNKMDLLLKEDAEGLSKFLARPVQTETHRIFPIENYGSAMAAFYTTLSLWVGSVVQIALLETETPNSYREKYGEFKPYQSYFGRLALFLAISFIQSTLIGLGNLYFLGIQCQHPVYFLVLMWIVGMIFAIFNYTLALSFGNVGKALCVILMVLQVAASGGTFPIEVAASFFQKIHPFLPFVHSIRAMQETIAGFYGMTYWKEILVLQSYVATSLLLGLVLRKPLIEVNEMLEEKLEETKLL